MKPEVILLGIIQRLTEWIPISSTGHIRLIGILLGMKPPLLFDVALHIGTVIVAIIFFLGDI
jgi:undecaprenyl-diphosphatase